MITVLIYDDECFVCRNLQKLVKKFDFRNNITPIAHSNPKSKTILQLFYGKEEVPFDFFILNISDDNSDDTLYRARKAIPQIIRAILRR